MIIRHRFSRKQIAALSSGDNLTMTEPREGVVPSKQTRVRADRKAIIVGIECFDDPAGIVSFSKKRDPDLGLRRDLGSRQRAQPGRLVGRNPDSDSVDLVQEGAAGVELQRAAADQAAAGGGPLGEPERG